MNTHAEIVHQERAAIRQPLFAGDDDMAVLGLPIIFDFPSPEFQWVPQDTKATVFGQEFLFHSGALGSCSNIFKASEDNEPYRSIPPGPIMYKFTARQSATGEGSWKLYPWGMRSPPGSATATNPAAHINLFKRFLMAAYWQPQRFSSISQVRALYDLAVWFGRYLWLGQYLSVTLQREENTHLGDQLTNDIIVNLKMVENLKIEWLFKDVVIRLMRSVPTTAMSQRSRMHDLLGPRAWYLVFTLFNRARRRLREVQMTVKLVYDALVEYRETPWDYHLTQERMIFIRRFEPYLRQQFPDRQRIEFDEIEWLAGLAKVLQDLRGSGLPVANVNALTDTRIVMALNAIESLTKPALSWSPPGQLGYITNVWSPEDRYPWEEIETPVPVGRHLSFRRPFRAHVNDITRGMAEAPEPLSINVVPFRGERREVALGGDWLEARL